MNQADFERIDWGLLEYGRALEEMRARHAARVAGQVRDAIICVEHPPVFTLGKRGTLDNILVGEDELARLGFSLHWVERGGDVTYHGPGQAVVYPVIDLRSRRMGVRALVEAVMEAICQVAQSYGLPAQSDSKRPGVWVEGKKLAAVGMAITEKVSMHGLAMNVNTNLDHFKMINACGLSVEPTSLKAELGSELDMAEVFDRLYAALAANFAAAQGTLMVEPAPSEQRAAR